jgi:hypothetical protein
VSPAATSASQSASDQIASLALQVAQVANDPTMPVETKTQQIYTLATQFNQLVAAWQQQLPPVTPGLGAQTTSSPGGLTPILSATPTPGLGASVGGTPTPTPSSPGSTLPGATPSTTPGALVSLTADQIRAQIAAVSQRMTAVSNDATLAPNVKAVQLQDLGNQFNQLVLQLQQVS